MADKYTLRRIDTAGDPSPARGLTQTLVKLAARLSKYDGPYTVQGEKRESIRPTLRGARRAVRHFLETGDDRVVVRLPGPVAFAVKRVAADDEPGLPGPANTPGTDQIDRIYAAVHAKFPETRDMGICANKPGEHGKCNAWDGGAPLTWSAQRTWDFIEEVAAYLKQQGILHDQTNGREGLPVNGVIVQDRYWETGNTSWRHYSGTKHVSHWHVSGKPSRTGWV